jgi:CheY-like chemotaxis protein
VAHKVLVGDDHEVMRQLVVELLQEQGYDVHQAEDTQSVIDGVRREKPDLLILDVHMPGGGGIEALRILRGDRDLADMPVLLLTGSIELTGEWPAELQVNAHLPKPFPVDELTSTVRSLLSA